MNKRYIYQRDNKFFTDPLCRNELVLDNQTADQWGEFMFEIENCPECGRDREDHFIIPFMGHWFAKCLKESIEEES